MKKKTFALLTLFAPLISAHAGVSFYGAPSCGNGNAYSASSAYSGNEDPRQWQATLNNGTLQMKQNASSPWIAVSNNVKSYQLQVNAARIGVLTTDGNFRVKEGAINSPWDDQETRVVSFQLEGDRIGVLRNDGNFEVKAGRLDGQWFGEETNVTSFRLAGDRIGVLKTNGILRVKEGKLDGAWDDEDTNVVSFRMEGKRIHVVRSNGSRWMKDGSLSAGWQPE